MAFFYILDVNRPIVVPSVLSSTRNRGFLLATMSTEDPDAKLAEAEDKLATAEAKLASIRRKGAEASKRNYWKSVLSSV